VLAGEVRAIVQRSQVKAGWANGTGRRASSACKLPKQLCWHQALVTTSFPQQGKRQGANLCTPTLRNAQQVAGQVEFVPQVVVEDLRRLCKLALGRVSREAGLLESPLHEIARAQCSSARAFDNEG